MKKTIAIAGLGWLGNPLAQHLRLLGYAVKGSVTSQIKATTLQQNGIDAYAVNITENGIEGAIQGFLKNVATLLVMIPPGLRRNTGADYVLKMSHFLSEILKSEVHNVVFISSTSVYSDTQGKVTEKDIPKPTTEAGRQLFQVEQLFYNAAGIDTSIVRFGGLIGGSRQPVRYLAGRTELRGGNTAVNLIHRNDCIGIISNIIKQEAYGHIFNGVHPSHPLKKNYYMQQAETLGLAAPRFTEEDKDDSNKQVDSIHLGSILAYSFKESL